MSNTLRMKRIAPRIAVAAAAFAAIALHGCGPDSISRYNPDSGVSVGDTTDETTSQAVLTSTYEGKPCIIKKNLTLTTGESKDLSNDISISLSSITLGNWGLMASLIVSARGEVPDEEGIDGSRYWTSLAHLNVWEGNFKEFEMGLNGNIIVSFFAGQISQDNINFDISVCIRD